MGKICVWLPKEEFEMLKQIQKLHGDNGSIHNFAKKILQEYLQGKIKNLAFEKTLKEVALELETLKKVMLDLQFKIEEKTEDRDGKEIKELLEEVLEKIEKSQVQPQGQVQLPEQSQAQSTEFVADILSAFREVGKRVIVIASEKQAFMAFIDVLIKKYQPK